MWEIWPFTNLFREASSCTTKLQRCQLKSGDFFFRLAPPPTEFTNAAPSGKFSIWTPTSNFAWKTWIYLSGSSIGLILIQSDSRLYNGRGQGSRSPGEEGGTQWTKKWTRKWIRMLSFGTVWKLHPGVWSSWLSWTLERYYEGWESGGKGAQKYGKRENVIREAEDSGPPVSPYPPPLSRSNKEETFFFLFATNNVHRARKWSQKP